MFFRIEINFILYHWTHIFAISNKLQLQFKGWRFINTLAKFTTDGVVTNILKAQMIHVSMYACMSSYACIGYLSCV